MEIICQLQSIHLSFGEKFLFDDASVTLHFGEKVGLLGPNGQGKSTLFKIMTGEIVPENSQPPFVFSKAKGKENRGSEKSFSIFHVPQELPMQSPEGFFPTARNYPFLFYPELMKAHQKMEQAEYQLQVEIMSSDTYGQILNQYESYLKLFAVENWDQPFHLMSGGEQRKIGLALGLSSPDNIILWDEPTNHLDMETIELFEEELQNSSKAMILISHDRYLMNDVCNRILHLEKGKLNSFEGNYYQYLNYLQEQEKKRQSLLGKLANHMRREEAWMRQGIKARGTRSKKRVENYQGLKETIGELKSQAKRQIQLSLYDSGKKTRKLVEMEEVSIAYQSQPLIQPLTQPLLSKMSLSIFKGEKIALLGRNGSGKSTLLKLIQGEIIPTEGIIKRHETLKIHLFDQKRVTLGNTLGPGDSEKTPFEIIGKGREMINLPGGETRHVSAYLESLLFSRNDLHRPIKTFSGGEKNRLQLALFLQQEADLWIFDEPTNDLDLETMAILEDKIHAFSGTVLIVSHDRAFLEQTTEKTWVIDEGELKVFEGGLEQAYQYIQAMKLERQASLLNLSQEEEGCDSQNNENTQKNLSPVKLSNKEKKRKEELPQLIEKWENTIKKLEQSMSEFALSEKAISSWQDLQQLQEERESAQMQLDLLYEEWLSIEEKLS